MLKPTKHLMKCRGIFDEGSFLNQLTTLFIWFVGLTIVSIAALISSPRRARDKANRLNS
ncbi:MAG: hypothetical protein WCG02_02320 [Candidatus Taylorbacteria bacterium]